MSRTYFVDSVYVVNTTGMTHHEDATAYCSIMPQLHCLSIFLTIYFVHVAEEIWYGKAYSFKQPERNIYIGRWQDNIKINLTKLVPNTSQSTMHHCINL